MPFGAALLAVVSLAGCSSMPSPPDSVGDDYPGTCMPPQFSWPSDFLESIPGEATAGGGAVVGLRLEYLDDRWAWRFRSTSSPEDALDEEPDDPARGWESLVDVQTHETIAAQEIDLTEAEQTPGLGAYGAAQESGETWPSPLIVEMARVMDDGRAVWRLTMCDTATNELSVITVS